MILCNGGFRLALAFYAQGFWERMHLRHQTQRVNPNPTLHYLKMQVVAGGRAQRIKSRRMARGFLVMSCFWQGCTERSRPFPTKQPKVRNFNWSLLAGLLGRGMPRPRPNGNANLTGKRAWASNARPYKSLSACAPNEGEMSGKHPLISHLR